MPFIHMLSDPGMNYTLNRPLLDGTSSARIKEIGAVAPQIKDYESWHATWLGLAKRAESEKRWLDAAGHLFRTRLGETGQGGDRLFQARRRRLDGCFLGRVSFNPGSRDRTADQAHHFAAHDVLRPRHDVEPNDAGQGARVDVAVY